MISSILGAVGRFFGRATNYLILLLGIAVGSGGGFVVGRIVGKVEGGAEIAARLNTQYTRWVETVRDRTIASERARAAREIARAKRSVRIIREVERDESCTSPGMDSCLRRYLELRHAAETADHAAD